MIFLILNTSQSSSSSSSGGAKSTGPGALLASQQPLGGESRALADISGSSWSGVLCTNMQHHTIFLPINNSHNCAVMLHR
jgi:hypothetical protein